MTDATTPTRPPPADLDRRFYAVVLDRVVAWTVAAAAVYLAVRPTGARDHPVLAVVLTGGIVVVVGVVLAVVLGLTGTSLGRAALGLRLVDAGTGAPIGVARALLRQLMLGLATLPTFGLGVAALAWTAVTDPGGRRQGWHDRVAGAEVVDVRPPPSEPVEADPGPRHVVNLTAARLVPAAPRAAAAVVRPGPSPSPVAPPAVPPVAPLTRWRVGFDTGESWVVEGPTLLGRDPEARPGEQARELVALRSSDLSLSKTHAELRLAGTGLLVVVDRGSTNGSFLLRHGATRELSAGRPTTLLDGDVVRLGDREMRVTRES